MSLQVWLPLAGNLDNFGLSNVAITNNGATVDNNGKIGKCYSFSSSYLQGTISTIPNGSWSAACWFYPTSSSSNAHQYMIGINTSSASDFKFTLCLSNDKICARTAGTTYQGSAIALNQWYHGAVTYDGSILKLYLNGDLCLTQQSPALPVSSSTLRIGDRVGNTGRFTGKLNDVRVYSHCLSSKEVKEISKALMLHYPLNSYLGGKNLITNGYGDLGTLNWGENGDSSNIPPNLPEVKQSYTGGRTTKELIPISSVGKYKIEMYVKTAGTNSSSTYCYPSLRGYDADKKEISHQHTADGFRANTLTTLTRDLNPGDTQIYVSSLANWSTDASNHAYLFALFGYKDSFGTLYPDLFYTRDVYTFSGKEDKASYIDKTNNIIKLKTAYAGPKKFSGTSICQSVYDSSYYYPFGGIATSTIQNWVYKSANISIATTNRLKPAKYLSYLAYYGGYQAGIKLTDLSWSDNQEIDCGIANIYNGTLAGDIEAVPETPRHSYSYRFTSGSYIGLEQTPFNTSMTDFTFAFWVKTASPGNTICFWNCRTAVGNPLAIFDIENGNFRFDDGSQHTFSNYSLPANVWTHCVFTRDATNIKLYINGELKQTVSSTPFTSVGSKATIGASSSNTAVGSGNQFLGSLSDYRIYGTCLSAEDVAELYHTAGWVYPGVAAAYELKEE